MRDGAKVETPPPIQERGGDAGGAPGPHRPDVVTAPKRRRGSGRPDRRRLGKRSQGAAEARTTRVRTAGKDPTAVPGSSRVVQTEGALVNVHPHLHALVTDGVRTPAGWFVACPTIDRDALEHLGRHRVLRPLLRERRIDATVLRKRLGWRHSGFSLHNAVRIGAANREGRGGGIPPPLPVLAGEGAVPRPPRDDHRPGEAAPGPDAARRGLRGGRGAGGAPRAPPERGGAPGARRRLGQQREPGEPAERADGRSGIRFGFRSHGGLP